MTFSKATKKCCDHDHFTGQYRGALCNFCNLQKKTRQRIPLYCHNLSGFDSHLIIKALQLKSEKFSVLSRDEEKIIKQQDVEAREAILELEKQLAEKEQKQKREIANIVAREEAEIAKVNEEERKKSEQARIATEEELQVAEENKLRQVIVAAKNKEKTEGIETERVQRERDLERTERERVVTLAQIEKE